MKLICKEDGYLIEDIFKNNHKCLHRNMCAGCEELITEDEYVECICDYDWEEMDGETIAGDYSEDHRYRDVPDEGMIGLELAIIRRCYPCKYGKYEERCNYKGECEFKVENYPMENY